MILMFLSTTVMTMFFVPPAKAMFGTSFDKYQGNPLATIPAYGASGVVHPDVLYFSGGMDGYKYWMVYTPYPPQAMENPSVVRSNDGITWTDSGIINPVVPEGTPGAWNDLENPDPDFIYVSDYNKWFLIWDGGDQATNSRKLALVYSSDGKTWTQYNGALVNGNPNPIILSGDDYGGQSWERAGSISKTSCPTLLYENGIFTLYYVEEASGNNNGQVGFATFTWNDATHSVENMVRYNNNPTIDLGCGHIDLSKKDNVYYLYVVKGGALNLLTSTDKISWTNQGTVLEGGDWDGSIYRSSATTDPTGQIALFDGKMKLYYSAFGSPQIGLATSKGPPAWYNPSWTRRKQITATNSNPSSLAGYQVKINIDYDSDMKTDFADLRFIDADGVTPIPYWIESYVASTSAAVWVRVPYIPASGSTTIYMYYGNSAATSLSDGRVTFELFDDFESGYGNGWTVKATMPSPPKADGSAAVYNGKLYVFGGYDQTSGDPRTETYEYDPSTNTWAQKANMPTARWGPIAVEFNGKIYVFSGTAAGVNEVYDPVLNTWETKSPMPSGFNQGLMGVRYGDRIHLFYHTLHYEYNPATDTYVAKTSMPTPRRWSTVAVVGDKIYVIGGFHNTYGAVNENEVYDPATDSWTTKTPMPVSKYGITRENPVINGKIYVTHGLDGGFHTDNYVYDPSTDSWQQKSSATYPRDGTECGVINNKLYVVGGRADSVGPYGVYYNEEYDPSSDTGILWAFSNSDKVKRDTSAKYQGNYGLMIYDDTSQSEYAEHTHTLPTLALDLDWDMTSDLGEATLQPQGRILLVDPSLSNYGTLYYLRDTDDVAKFKWYTGSYTTLQSGSWNNWYHITIIWNGANSKVVINGVEHPVSATSAISDGLRLESSTTEISKMYFDSVRVRKYASPEPTVTVGSEEVVPPPPVASFTWSPTEPKASELVTFDASSSTPGGGSIVAYEWDFGDGRTGTDQIATHTYSKKGTYVVSLRVTDSLGMWDTEQKPIQIAPLPPTPAPWFDASWTRRKSITIDNTFNPNALTGYQIKLTVDYDSHMKTDFSDLRFMDSSGVTLIPYWMEKYTASVSAVIWVRIPNIPASDTTTVYMYYGNPSATSVGNGTATFEFFEDFETAYVLPPWTQKEQMPSLKSDTTAAVYNGKLYVFGGYGNGGGDLRKETYVYDPSSNSWTQKTDIPTGRWGPLAVECNGLIYVFGGTANVNEVYDPTSDTWSTKSSLPSGFDQGLMGVRYGNTIHLFYQSLHYEYDPIVDTYTRKADVPTWRTWGTCAVVGDKIYVIGGYSYGPSSTGAVNVNEVYDPATDTWTTKAPMPISKYGVTRENPVINGKIYVTHGLNGGFHTDNYVYDPSTDSWQQKSSAVHPRDGVGCGVINNKLYVVGGRADYSGPYGLVYNEEYDPSTDTGAPSPWTVSDPNKVKRDPSAKYEGSYGLMIYEDVLTTAQYAEHTQNYATCAVDLLWDVTDAFGIASLQPQGRILLADTANPALGSLYYYNDNGPKFKWYTGSFTELQSGSWNTWYQVTMVWNGANSKVIINDVEHSVSAASVSSDRIYLGTNEHTKMYFDLIRVRKYSSQEPTLTTGAEETPPPIPPPAPWYDISWTKRKPVSIVSTCPVSLTGYQVKISVAYDSDMKNDFSDLRFTDSDGATLLPYWVEGLTPSTSATVWVKVPSIPASSTKTIYMYYCNPAASTASNGDATFEFFDNFTGTALNTGKWTQNAVNTITDSVNDYFRFKDATKSGGTYWIYGDSRGRIGSQHQANWTPLTQFVMEFKSTLSDTATSQMGEGFVGVVSSTSTVIGVAGYQDWMGGGYDSQRAVITENQASSLGTGVAKRGDSQYDAYKAVGQSDATSWKIINDGSTLKFYDGDGFYAEASMSSTVSKVALAAGAYGGYPYLDYVQIDYVIIHKYASIEPTSSVGAEQTFGFKIESCDSMGTGKDIFNVGETVYVTGSGYPPSTAYDTYIVQHTTWTDGMQIPTRISGTADSVSTNSSGNIPPTIVWNSLVAGKYDIVVDVNGNGRYDVSVDALDNGNVEPNAGFSVVGQPTLVLNPASRTCRRYNETFTVQINVSMADNVEDFSFEIHYNATLLDVTGISWNAWPSGTYTADEVNGNLTGHTSGNPISGDATLLTITFNATYHHIWKDESTFPGWKNNQTGTIYFQWANLSSPGSPDLSYVRGGTQNQINVGQDLTYTFSPIQGDINNDGSVDIFDLRTVATFYRVKIGDPNWGAASAYDLNHDGIIDIFDLVIIAVKLGAP
jgi:hypothetical protein